MPVEILTNRKRGSYRRNMTTLYAKLSTFKNLVISLSLLSLGLILNGPQAMAEGSEDSIEEMGSGDEASMVSPTAVNPKATLHKGAVVGRAAAQKYFTQKPSPPIFLGTRVLGLHAGGYLNSKSYLWGEKSSQTTGVQTLGVTYKIGEWIRTMDLNLRIDYFVFQRETERPIKISFLPLLTFPDAGADFPLYFGAGIGPGVFLSQIKGESLLTVDYQLIFGIKWNDIWPKTGFFIESGIKDHIHVLSDGQFSSQFLTAGAVFKL